MNKNKQDTVKQRVPYGLPIVENYTINSIKIKSNKFENDLKKRIDRLRKQGNNISSCKEYLTSVVEEYVSELETTLESEHYAQKRFLDAIFLRRATDKMDFEKLLDEVQGEIDSTEAEFALVKSLYEECNPLYQGRINLKGEPSNISNIVIDDNHSEESED